MSFKRLPKYRPVYRTYHFVHRILEPIQKGIQAEHAAKEVFLKYFEDNPSTAVQREHLSNLSHPDNKTTIVLQGGNHAQLRDLAEWLLSWDNKYPHAYFCEDQDTACGMYTAVTIVVPDTIWNCPYPDEMYGNISEEFIQYVQEMGLNAFEVELCRKIKTAKLVR